MKIKSFILLLFLLIFSNLIYTQKSAKIIHNNDKYGLLDRNGNKILETKYSNIIQVNIINDIHLFSYRKEDGNYAFVYEIYIEKDNYKWVHTDFIFDSNVNAYYYKKDNSEDEYTLAIIYSINGLKGVYITNIIIGIDDFDTDIFITDTIKNMIDPIYKDISYEFTKSNNISSQYLITLNEEGLKGFINLPRNIIYPPKYKEVDLDYMSLMKVMI